jgi:hypothetical protein
LVISHYFLSHHFIKLIIFTMLSRAAPLARIATRSIARPAGFRAFTAVPIDVSTAADAAALSGYSEIDYIIKDDATVLDAVQKFAAYNIGCLVTTDAAGR